MDIIIPLSAAVAKMQAAIDPLKILIGGAALIAF
jgi:hypothetical protein